MAEPRRWRGAATVADGSDVRRARAQINLSIPESGRTIGPGQPVDLNEPMGAGTVRDHVNEAWFEPVEAPPAPPAPVVPEERE